MTMLTQPVITRQKGEPTWEIANLFPPQGYWSEEAYLELTASTQQLIELVDGYLEVLPMPKLKHQRAVRHLLLMLNALARLIGGEVLFAPLRMYLSPLNYREPDLLFWLSAQDPRLAGDDYAQVADLVVEVVSPDEESQERDYVRKREAYARAGILEYWIVDPQTELITVLRLDGKVYVEHGAFKRGDIATSALLPDLRVEVSAVFDSQ
jgi:Uma2 family endonuclease